MLMLAPNRIVTGAVNGCSARDSKLAYGRRVLFDKNGGTRRWSALAAHSVYFDCLDAELQSCFPGDEAGGKDDLAPTNAFLNAMRLPPRSINREAQLLGKQNGDRRLV
jgi:hypothetical protein